MYQTERIGEVVSGVLSGYCWTPGTVPAVKVEHLSGREFDIVLTFNDMKFVNSAVFDGALLAVDSACRASGYVVNVYYKKSPSGVRWLRVIDHNDSDGAGLNIGDDVEFGATWPTYLEARGRVVGNLAIDGGLFYVVELHRGAYTADGDLFITTVVVRYCDVWLDESGEEVDHNPWLLAGGRGPALHGRIIHEHRERIGGVDWSAVREAAAEKRVRLEAFAMAAESLRGGGLGGA